MAAVGACLLPAVLFNRRSVGKLYSNQISSVTPRLAVSVDRSLVSTAESHGTLEKEKAEKVLEEKEKRRMNGWNEYLEQSKELIGPDGGPPRWFSPLECASHSDNSPLLLFLPGQYFSLSFTIFLFSIIFITFELFYLSVWFDLMCFAFWPSSYGCTLLLLYTFFFFFFFFFFFNIFFFFFFLFFFFCFFFFFFFLFFFFFFYYYFFNSSFCHA